MQKLQQYEIALPQKQIEQISYIRTDPNKNTV